MARKKIRRIVARVTLPEWELVQRWARKNRADQSTIVRDMIELMRKHLERLEAAEIATADLAAHSRLEIARQVDSRTA